jgi:hypothetical protein
MIYNFPLYQREAVLKMLQRIAELPSEKKYIDLITIEQIHIIEKLHEKIFDKARWLWTDLMYGGNVSRVKTNHALLSSDELDTLASCVAIWDWLFPAELCHDEFNGVRFALKDFGRRTI